LRQPLKPPLLDAYQGAVQNPSLAFKDVRLKASRPVTNLWGLPAPASGGFAVAFQLRNPRASSWAVRCFQHIEADLGDRYLAISQFIRSHPTLYWVEIDYLHEGIVVDGHWWPITMMPWVEGAAFNDWVKAHLEDAAALAAAQEAFREVVASMESLGSAHGDLQHGNIVMDRSGRPVLIDYDGMFVPALRDRKMSEVGHRNYQHPDRASLAFGPTIDRFSAIVVWSALDILQRQPELWDRYDTGENLLFCAKDFSDPAGSPLFASLGGARVAGGFAEALRRVFTAPADKVPSLDDFIAGRLPTATVRLPRPIVSGAPYPVVDLRLAGLDRREGDRVVVVGELDALHEGLTSYGGPYRNLRLVGAEGRLRVAVTPEVLATRAGFAEVLRPGDLLAVTGLVTRHDLEMQIVLERLSHLERLTPARVHELLGSDWKSPPQTVRRAALLRTGDVVEHPSFGLGTVRRIDGEIATIQFGVRLRAIHIGKYPLSLVRRAAPAALGPRASAPQGPGASPPSGKLRTVTTTGAKSAADLSRASAEVLNRLYTRPGPPSPAVGQTPSGARQPRPRPIPRSRMP
jgi:hypothetical protein